MTIFDKKQKKRLFLELRASESPTFAKKKKHLKFFSLILIQNSPVKTTIISIWHFLSPLFAILLNYYPYYDFICIYKLIQLVQENNFSSYL